MHLLFFLPSKEKRILLKCLKLVNEVQALVVMADILLCNDCSLPLALPLFGEIVSLAFLFMASLSGFLADLTIISKFGI